MLRSFFRILFVFILIHAASTPCEASKDTLTVAMKTPFDALGLCKSTTREAMILNHHWADTLVYRDPQLKRLVPCLAESYAFTGKGQIDFTLRKGIRFHNGEPFNAEAVKASFHYFKSLDLPPTTPDGQLTKAIVLNDHAVRIQSTLPNNIALETIANVLFMVPPDYLKTVGPDVFCRQPIGTGPYRFVSWDRPSLIEFEANPDYFGGPKGKPRIPHLRVRIIPEEMLRVECLLNGEVDLIRGGAVAPDQLPLLKRPPSLDIEETTTMRIFFLAMDAMGKSGVDFFKDKRVRQAVNHAVDREALAEKVLGGHAIPTHTITTPFHFGYENEVAEYAYDPDRARALLTEVGYPSGFTTDFYFTRDESVAEAIARDLNAVGIKTRLIFMPKWKKLREEIVAGRTPLVFLATGAYSIFDAGAVLDLYFPLSSPRCLGSTAEIDRLLKEANRTFDADRRKGFLSQAQKAIASEAFWVPLFYGNSVAAMAGDLNFTPSYDEIDRYFAASWDAK